MFKFIQTEMYKWARRREVELTRQLHNDLNAVGVENHPIFTYATCHDPTHLHNIVILQVETAPHADNMYVFLQMSWQARKQVRVQYNYARHFDEIVERFEETAEVEVIDLKDMPDLVRKINDYATVTWLAAREGL